MTHRERLQMKNSYLKYLRSIYLNLKQ